MVGGDEPKARSKLEQEDTGLVTTSDVFLPISHGRHTFPVGFLIAAEVKILLAYTVINYEIEPLPVKPHKQWIGPSAFLPSSAIIRVRRKEGTVK